MFKNISIFRLTSGLPSAVDVDVVGEALHYYSFAPCDPTQTKSVGWVPPRGEEHGALIESVSRQQILKLMIETRSVPSAAVRKKADEAAERVEQDTGRKPGKKQMKELREDALLALLPQAFPRQAAVWVWIDRDAGLLVIDATGGIKLDTVLTALGRTFDGLQISAVQTNETPVTAMAKWLTVKDDEDLPPYFSIGRQCNLKGCDEEKAVVKFDRHNLATDEVRRHIAEGKLPTSLALEYDGRVSFVLTDSFALKKIKLLDIKADDSGDAFDADVALLTGELQRLIPALTSALGREITSALWREITPADPLFGE